MASTINLKHPGTFLNCWFILILISFSIITGCSVEKSKTIQTVNGRENISTGKFWLSHEHILVDFVGADSINPQKWNHESVINALMPSLSELKEHNVTYFVDATPQYLGRDPVLLKKISDHTGLRILTNTGFYGARKNKYIPEDFWSLSSEQMAEKWIGEFQNGIGISSIRPGFIKISVDNTNPLDTIHKKIVKAAAITHLQTGLVIASHTGKAKALWPQLEILRENDVNPENFIWVHAQAEEDFENYLIAARKGCWISLDGIGWGLEEYVSRLQFAKQEGILGHILISHDAGWYDPQKKEQKIQPYSTLFEQLILRLKSVGFIDSDLNLLLSVNPSKAYEIKN